MDSELILWIAVFVLALCLCRFMMVFLRTVTKKYSVPKFIRDSFIVLADLYKNISGIELSLAERTRLQLMLDPHFTYGEIDPGSFAAILEIAQPKRNEIFLDLGCGAGKAVFSAALLYPWKKCCGVEMLPALYDCCLTLEKKFLTLPSRKKYFPRHPVDVEFFQQNFLEANIKNADIVFLHATTFAPDIWLRLQDKLTELKKGARIITVTKRLNISAFEEIHHGPHAMSWGQSSVNIYRKV